MRQKSGWVKAASLMALALGLTACGGTYSGDEQSPKSSGAAGSGATAGANPSSYAGSTGAGWPPSDALHENAPTSEQGTLACPSHEPLNALQFDSLIEKQQAMIGTWLKCSRSGIGPEDAAGLEITPDGAYAVLIRDAAGALVPGVGVRYHGHIELDGNWVNFAQPGIAEQSALLFSDEVPYRMYAYNTDFIGYDYVR